jgi:hypothetical protein
MVRRLEDLKRELARRIGPLLPDVPAEQFEELIEIVASLQYDREQRHPSTRDALPPSETAAPAGRNETATGES